MGLAGLANSVIGPHGGSSHEPGCHQLCGSAEIARDSVDVIRRSAEAIKRAPAGSKVEIGGHRTTRAIRPATRHRPRRAPTRSRARRALRAAPSQRY